MLLLGAVLYQEELLPKLEATVYKNLLRLFICFCAIFTKKLWWNFVLLEKI